MRGHLLGQHNQTVQHILWIKDIQLIFLLTFTFVGPWSNEVVSARWKFRGQSLIYLANFRVKTYIISEKDQSTLTDDKRSLYLSKCSSDDKNLAIMVNKLINFLITNLG